MTPRQAQHCLAMQQRASAPSVPQVPRWMLSPAARAWARIFAALAKWNEQRGRTSAIQKERE